MKERNASLDFFAYIYGIFAAGRRFIAACFRIYKLQVFEKAAANLKEAEIPFIVHTILGLPGEDRSRILQTIDYVSGSNGNARYFIMA